MMNYFQQSIFFILIICSPLRLDAAGTIEFHPHSDIRNTVEQFLSENLQETKGIEIVKRINPLDPRLKLSKCKLPLEAFSASNINQTAKFSIGVKCKSSKPWSLYITVNIEKITTLYSAALPISRGETISTENIVVVKYNISRLRQDFFRDKTKLVGMIAKRHIRAGTIIGSKHLKPPLLIKKGDRVDIVAQTSAIAIRVSGEALSDGAKGQKIRVKNNSSKKIINAIVTTSTTVSIRL